VTWLPVIDTVNALAVVVLGKVRTRGNNEQLCRYGGDPRSFCKQRKMQRARNGSTATLRADTPTHVCRHNVSRARKFAKKAIDP
jgi:hypothetical protein